MHYFYNFGNYEPVWFVFSKCVCENAIFVKMPEKIITEHVRVTTQDLVSTMLSGVNEI